MNLTRIDWLGALPGVLLALFGSAALLSDFIGRRHAKSQRWSVAFALVGLAFTAFALFGQEKYVAAMGPLGAFQGALIVDRMALLLNWLFLAASLLVVLFSYRYMEVEGETEGEYYGLLLLAQCGMYFLATGAELVTLLVSVEVMSACFYVLVGFFRRSRRSTEAALKYLLLSAFSTGLLAYGTTFLYGLSGSTLLWEIREAVAARPANDPWLLLAIVTMAAGLLFKIAAAPFHVWAPDAYEGAPSAVAAHLSVASKAASFALIIRLFPQTLGGVADLWQPVLVLAAVVSLLLGSFAALTQSNLKRMLAYSSVAHVGYLLLGLVAGNQAGLQGVLIYLLVYLLMNLGAFLVLVVLRGKTNQGETLDDIAGLFRRSPWHAILMIVCLLSLAGLPPTAGFIGKYAILAALIESGHYVLAAVAGLFVAVSAYFYFRVVRAMIGAPPETEEPLSTSFGTQIAAVAIAAGTLILGIFPEPLFRWASAAVGGGR